MSNQQLIRWVLLANGVALFCGLCFVCTAIGLNFAPDAQPSPWLANFIPGRAVLQTAETAPEAAVNPEPSPTAAPPTVTPLPLPTETPTLPVVAQPIFRYHCDMRRPDDLEHRCYEVTVLPIGDPVAECAAAITTGSGTWGEGACSTQNRVGTCTGGLLILDNPPKTYRFYADNGSYDVASATAFCDTLQGQFTADGE